VKVFKHPLGLFKTYKNLVIGEFDSKVELTPALVQEFVKMASNSFKKKKFAYISNQINTYTFDPTIYQEVLAIKNLVGVAWVVKKEKAEVFDAVQISPDAFKTNTFNSLEAALLWSESLLGNVHIYKHPIGELRFYDDFIISSFDESANVTTEVAAKIMSVIVEFAPKKPYTYISNRINNYTVQTQGLVVFKKDPFLKKIAVVSKNPKDITSLFEKSFIAKQLENFHSLTEAILWAKS
jgi:hypothetical protein